MTGAGRLIGRVVDLQTRRGKSGETLRGVLLVDAGGAGLTVQAGGKLLFLPWAAVGYVATAAQGGGPAEEPAPDLGRLRELWGDDAN